MQWGCLSISASIFHPLQFVIAVVFLATPTTIWLDDDQKRISFKMMQILLKLQNDIRIREHYAYNTNPEHWGNTSWIDIAWANSLCFRKPANTMMSQLMRFLWCVAVIIVAGILISGHPIADQSSNITEDNGYYHIYSKIDSLEKSLQHLQTRVENRNFTEIRLIFFLAESMIKVKEWH